MTNHADIRAAYARLWAQAEPSAGRWPSVVLLPEHRAARPGWAVWGVLGTRAVTVLPELLPDAPPEVQRRYLARVTATLAGRCPLCGEAAGLSADPTRTPASWQVTPLTVGIAHPEGCPAVFTEADRRWFDPRAVGRSHGHDIDPRTRNDR